ncbi:unnamed protein product, partial [marine sediment metagenome]
MVGNGDRHRRPWGLAWVTEVLPPGGTRPRVRITIFDPVREFVFPVFRLRPSFAKASAYAEATADKSVGFAGQVGGAGIFYAGLGIIFRAYFGAAKLLEDGEGRIQA